jgi:tripartite-type tricarboxylate transporter receptor subunit TctC
MLGLRTLEGLAHAHIPAAFAVVALLALGGQAGWAQPQQTIRIIIPFPPGGATDIVGRLLADQISRKACRRSWRTGPAPPR